MSGYDFITASDDLALLISRIKNPERTHIVVHALPEGVNEPLIDVEDLARRIEGDAAVYVVDFEMGFCLTEGLGGKTFTVHSGWTRIYPPLTWSEGDQNKNRFEPATARTRKRQILSIEHRVLDLSFGSYLPVTRDVTSGLVPSAVIIEQMPSAHDGLVFGRLPNRDTAHVITSGLYRGIPNNRLLRKGMELPGEVSGGLLPHFYAIRPPDDPHARTRKFVGAGIETWVFVSRVNDSTVEVLIHPEVMGSIHGEADESLDLQFTQGETIPVIILPSEAGFEIALSDSNNEISEAISALPDGPAWLLPPEPIEELENLDGEALSDELVIAHRLIEKQDLEISNLKKKLRESQRVAKSRTERRPHDSALHCFETDIRHAYLEKFPDRPDRSSFPLAPMAFAPEIMDGVWRASDLTSYAKVVEKAMLLACSHPSATVEAYKFRSTWAKEIDGWKFFRGHIVEDTPGAPRFVIGKKNGVVRFEACGHHDEELKS